MRYSLQRPPRPDSASKADFFTLSFCILHLFRLMTTFTEEELQAYEAEICEKPLDQLYQELLKAEEDEAPERKKIIKARIAILEKRERRKARAEQKILDTPQPLPDKSGLFQFLLVIAGTFLILFLEFIPHIHISDFFSGRFLASIKYIPAIGIIFLSTRYIPIFRTYLWEEKDSPKGKDIPSYWLRHFKMALSIASYFFFFSIETFVRGDYNGLFFYQAGLPAYIIATGYFIFSTLYIINAFYPLSKKFRPKYGIALLTFAVILNLIIEKIFG